MRNFDTFKRMKKGFDFSQAIAEADRCLLCHDAPCSKGCPSDTEPGAFIRKLHLKNITGAIRTIKENNILGGACGVLCPTERLCEKECSAMLKSKNLPSGQDRAIRIGEIQRFLIEYSWERGYQVLKKPEQNRGKVAVVGSGPGGLSCAAELAQAGFLVTIFEARPEPGGVLRYGVAPFRFDEAFLKKELADIEALGVEFKCNHPIAGEKGAEKLLENGFNAVFLAPGLWKAAPLKPDQAEIKGLFSSVDYLSSLRDGRLEQTASQIEGKKIAVIGGGAVAMDCIETAAKLGPKDVYLVYRRSFLQMPAEEPEIQSALQAGVHFLLLNQPLDYLTTGDNQISGIKVIRTRLGDPDDSGRRAPVEIAGSEWNLDADIVIEAIGNQAEDNSTQWYPGVETDAKKLIKTNPETGETSVKGIFAGGDIVRGPSLVVNAVRDGKVAAQAIQQYLNKEEVR
ncbi:MAG: FAD-dependent oxidoreductase [Deltaproteobacteria bacterium]|nr:FAD-dependent oxidoreductase [Deltaproteobacteria bacterium]MBT4637321.1 FAD-dependent oxidoreductase [Deltaproteobacteria bacterium]MBT6504365.1 FAD-dependent oxidoreductase [Deltaproteobacteria bacterium]MBT7154549.1 FAD-dependent oxidoreductase [Deltaproteobacteria bacterium]MBT7716400.1 FAD-dependent oxidoreductase [Deltaproteobacteria bacterium]